MTPATAERERCARLIELIAADWREAGAMQKVWASEYLARQIRDLADEQQPVSLAEMRQPEEREKNERMKALIDVVGQVTIKERE